MKRAAGRKGTPTEYVQYEPRITLVAQKGAGGWWNVFKVNGESISTLAQFKTKARAVRRAKEIAENL